MSVLRRRFRTLEAIVALIFAWLVVRMVPFAAISRLVGSVRGVTADDLAKAPAHDPIGTAVGRSLAAAAARLPWHSTCLVRALAGGLMLRRRGVESTLVLGVTRSEEALRAHAWLIAGGRIVCGGQEAPEYLPIAVLRRAGAHTTGR